MAIPNFRIETEVKIGQAATVICLRETKGRRPTDVLHRDMVCPPPPEPKKGKGRGGAPPAGGVDGIFQRVGELDFCFQNRGWEVLMGQNECVNWMKTKGLSRQETSTMRYPGEYKFAGGALDPGESFHAAAQRELEEEFLRPCGQALPAGGARLRPFAVKQTMPIRDRSDILWNFVALAEENPWLENLDIEAANAGLAERRARFEEVLGREPSGAAFFALPEKEREALSPEVRELRWVPLSEAVLHSFTTMLPPSVDGTVPFVNDWQAAEFGRLKIKKRDPMFMTGMVLLEVASFPSKDTLARHCDERLAAQCSGSSSSAGSVEEQERAAMAKEQAEVQWLTEGMTDVEFQEVLKHRRKGGRSKMIDCVEVMRLREERAAMEGRQRPWARL